MQEVAEVSYLHSHSVFLKLASTLSWCLFACIAQPCSLAGTGQRCRTRQTPAWAAQV